MSKNEINRKLDQIIDFSGIGSYIDTPVKRYSSGMMVRLGFAVAAHLEPDILIVDEVLAVGDAEFQNKCIGKIKDISSQGRTVLFVSHNMTSLKRLCNRGVLLENGKVIYDGLINEAIKKYNKNHINDESISSIKIEDIIEKPIQFSLIKIIDSKNNKSKNIFEFIEDIKLEITYTVRKNYNDFYTAILLYNYNGDLIMVSADNDSTQEGLLNSGLGQKKLSVIIPKELLNLGKYYLSFSVRRISDDRDKHKIDNCLVFEVIDTISYRSMKNFYRKEAMIAPDILWKSIK
jgi:lipopolysaccharide transport system ATP-binding protein